MEDIILELIEDLGAKSYKKGVDWNGYKVYIPQYKGNPCIGLPYVVLEKGDEIRVSTPEESIEYLEYEKYADDMGMLPNEDKEDKDYQGKGIEHRQNAPYEN